MLQLPSKLHFQNLFLHLHLRNKTFIRFMLWHISVEQKVTYILKDHYMYINHDIIHRENMEQEEMVEIEFVKPMRVNKNEREKNIDVDKLFKEIKYETEKQKQRKKIKEKSTNIYDKIAITLQKKIGSVKSHRVSLDDQEKVQDLIGLCRQQKHIRNRNYSSRPAAIRPTSKQKKIENRPKTCRPGLQRSTSSFELHRTYKRSNSAKPIKTKDTDGKSRVFSTVPQKKNEIEVNMLFEKNEEFQLNKFSNLKKAKRIGHTKGVKSSKVVFSENKSTLNSDMFSIMDLDLHQKQNMRPFSRNQRSKCMKGNEQINTRLRIQNSVKAIIGSCDSTKKQIEKIGKKVGFFQYYSMRLNRNLEEIQKILPQKSDYEDLYD